MTNSNELCFGRVAILQLPVVVRQSQLLNSIFNNKKLQTDRLRGRALYPSH